VQPALHAVQSVVEAAKKPEAHMRVATVGEAPAETVHPVEFATAPHDVQLGVLAVFTWYKALHVVMVTEVPPVATVQAMAFGSKFVVVAVHETQLEEVA